MRRRLAKSVIVRRALGSLCLVVGLALMAFELLNDHGGPTGAGHNPALFMAGSVLAVSTIWWFDMFAGDEPRTPDASYRDGKEPASR